MTPEELDALYEASKDDRHTVVGSQVRQLVGTIRRERASLAETQADRDDARALLAAALAAAEELGAVNARQADALALRDATIRVMHQESVAAVRATVAERDDATRRLERVRRFAAELHQTATYHGVPEWGGSPAAEDAYRFFAKRLDALLASPDAARPALPTPCEGHNHDPSDECGIYCPARSISHPAAAEAPSGSSVRDPKPGTAGAAAGAVPTSTAASSRPDAPGGGTP